MTQLQDTGTVAIMNATDGRWYGAASSHVVRFLHRLRCIPAATWLELTMRSNVGSEPSQVLADRPIDALVEEQEDYAARARLHTVLESTPAVMRRIRQRVNSDLAVFEGIVPKGAVQRMRRTAHVAAFALAVHDKLTPEDFWRLYKPFVDLIPPPRELLPQ